MPKKLYDLAVKTGEYQDRATGQTKGRWANVGAFIQADDGGKFLLIDPHFNFAAVAREPGRDRVTVSMFGPDRGQQGQAPQGQGQHQAPPAPPSQPAPQGGGGGWGPPYGDVPFGPMPWVV